MHSLTDRRGQQRRSGWLRLAQIGSLLLIAAAVIGCSSEDGWIQVATVDDFQSGEPLGVTMRREGSAGVDSFDLGPAESVRSPGENEQVLFLFRDPDGGVVSLLGADPRLGCTVHWVPDEQIFINPCHGQHYNLDGECFSGPCLRGLDRIETRIDGERVLISLGASAPGPPPLTGTPDVP